LREAANFRRDDPETSFQRDSKRRKEEKEGTGDFLADVDMSTSRIGSTESLLYYQFPARNTLWDTISVRGMLVP
jgi:hypothetical protein